MEKEKNIFEIDELIKETYNEIAVWHNDDGSKEGLKTLSIELIEKISSASFQHLGLGPAKVGVTTVPKKEIKTSKKKWWRRG